MCYLTAGEQSDGRGQKGRLAHQAARDACVVQAVERAVQASHSQQGRKEHLGAAQLGAHRSAFVSRLGTSTALPSTQAAAPLAAHAIMLMQDCNLRRCCYAVSACRPQSKD
jgi:hypothetical protein